MRAALREAEVAAFGDDLDAQLVRVDAHRVVAAVADLGVGLVTRLHVGADAAVPQQVRLHAQDGAHDILAGRFIGVELQQLTRPERSGIFLALRGKTPPPELIKLVL